MNNKTIIEDYCTYDLKKTSPNNSLSSLLYVSAFLGFHTPAYFFATTIGAPIAVIESLLIEEVLQTATKITGFTIADSLHQALYPTINAIITFKLTHILAGYALPEDVSKGISSAVAISTLLGSFVYPPHPPLRDTTKDSKDTSAIWASEIFYSFLGAGVVAGCPLTLTAKAIDKIMESIGMAEEFIGVSQFPHIPEALYSAGGLPMDGYDRYPLHNAAALNQRERVISLLDSLDETKKKIVLTESDIGDGSTYTAFTLAAFHGHKDMIELFAANYQELQISINSRDKDGKTALMILAAKGHMEAFQFLAEKYASLDINMDEKDNAGNTAIHYIAATLLYSTPSLEQLSTYKNIIQLLIKNGLNINALNNQGKTALEIIESGDTSSVLAQKLSENLEAAHLVGKLLHENPDISTLMKRMSENMPNIKNEKGNEKGLFKLFSQNSEEEAQIKKVLEGNFADSASYNTEEYGFVLHQEIEDVIPDPI